MVSSLKEARNLVTELDAEVSKRVVGMEPEKRFTYITMFAPGLDNHLLMESVPGLGKTLLGATLAECCDLKFSHIQFQPDLLPSDIRGAQTRDQGNKKWEFYPGPVFANFILGDELNRASPKTAAALLGPMQELIVTTTFCGVFKLEPPFIVLATQNPIGRDGSTNRLAEAQRDRFLMRIDVNYLSVDEMVEVLKMQESMRVGEFVDSEEKMREIKKRVEEKIAEIDVKKVLNGKDILNIRDLVNDNVFISPKLQRKIAQIVELTHPTPTREIVGGKLIQGASTRVLIGLQRASKAKAFLEGRKFVTPRDIIFLMYYLSNHRFEYNESVAPEKESEILRKALNTIFLEVFGENANAY